ncbi:hypothetical protein [Amycolatopsis magusensis]|uniref:hypothetical protein n=1 Tax=Amycolatopsis magusensis TaxID=882444 RepID=UPI0024A9C1F3|nr:hypothetical protein [Amycolatopsis magusensis]MDI5979646.1 hypothetical protein [Amycolatopsis magusensis]
MIEVDSRPGYVLPFRCEQEEDLTELTAYLSRLSRHAEVVVIADDDVRYEPHELAAAVRLLEHSDLVVPQNYFRPLPWRCWCGASPRTRGCSCPSGCARRTTASPSPRGLGGAGAAGMALVSAVAVAEAGRRRAGGTAVFPADCPLWVPLWLAERGVCSWLALALRLLRGGVAYRGGRLEVAAHSDFRLAREQNR